MPIFAYKAIDQAGKRVSGTLEAGTPAEAGDKLTAQGLIPSAIAEATGAARAGDSKAAAVPRQASPGRIRMDDLVLFTKQFSTMIRAALPLLRLFEILEAQTENRHLRAVVSRMMQDIHEGVSLSDAFGRHPKVFSSLYVAMIHAGEASGSLSEVLDRLIYIISHEHKMRQDIRSACRYPLIVVVLLFAAFMVLLTFVVPRFAAIFVKVGIELPLPTRMCLGMYSALAHYWPLIIGVLVVGGFGLRQYLRTAGGQLALDTFLLRIPIVGPLVIKATMSRFASIFAILQSSGVSVLDSIAILRATIGNAAISREFDRISDQLVQGRGIAGPLRSARFFTPMVVNMAAIGEESGNLDEMLREVSTHYDAEVEYATKRLADAIAPILTVGLAVVVGFFALAIYLPIWDLSKMVR